MQLKWIGPILTLAATLTATPAGYAQTNSPCHTGKLLDVQQDSETVPALQAGRVRREGRKEWTTVDVPSTRKLTTYTVKVALDGIIFTAQSNGAFWSYNPSRMIVGDELEACVEANRLVIKLPNGGHYKPTVIRRERDQPSAAERRQERLP